MKRTRKTLRSVIANAVVSVAIQSVPVAALVGAAVYTPSASSQGIPVMDIITESSTMSTWLETVLSYVDQILEWEDNVSALTDMMESPFEDTVNGILEIVDMMDSHFGEYGGLDGYLDFFKDVPGYALTECFVDNVQCSAGRIAELLRSDRVGLKAMKASNDRVFKNIKQQQDNLRTTATRLKDMQAKTSGVMGRNAQIQAVSQLTGEMANELLEIRTLMIAKQQMDATAQAKANNDASRALAASETMFKRTFRDSTFAVPW